ncbi:hypothetical protein CGZ93_13580 [Enemella dayhoffiae]|uniref:N-acetylmuramoyl-L-alanine amidase n=1 Tax=Enemella dayhoffiae TaxID=2016507 RepID=A0A255GUL7_9ACTN|nr:N-acetylmuramoyl-L-alanine amidase [Enemella dayhoffiae]OYO19385.1 hypothetical protein CGZ93_13580 [Enemella dayhoffiae]
MAPLSRRALLGSSVGAALAAGLAQPARAEVAPPPIRPRSEWAGGLTPLRPMRSEQPGDVRFLLVHHSESPNTDRAGGTPQRLRGFFTFHTSVEKGWPDVAYNFFVDRFGDIWEGRAGSLAGPVMGDATGGSQGFAQLACFIGDHATQPPTEAAMASMTRLLAWLAGRYRIDLGAGPSIRFTSRGSNRWPAGRVVSTDPIAGHRDMSQTACPGDALYPLIRSRLLPEARRLLGTVPTPAPGGGTPRAATPSASATPSATAAPTPEGGWTTKPVTVRPPGPPPAAAAGPAEPESGVSPVALAAGAVAAVGVSAGAVAAGLHLRRTPRE